MNDFIITKDNTILFDKIVDDILSYIPNLMSDIFSEYICKGCIFILDRTYDIESIVYTRNNDDNIIIFNLDKDRLVSDEIWSDVGLRLARCDNYDEKKIEILELPFMDSPCHPYKKLITNKNMEHPKCICLHF